MYREIPVTETGTRESAYRESYALALAAERVRRIIADESLEQGTMVAIMVALADYRFHYRAGSELTDVTARAEFRRATMRRALEGTAQNPPLPELKGYVDAGALGFLFGSGTIKSALDELAYACAGGFMPWRSLLQMLQSRTVRLLGKRERPKERRTRQSIILMRPVLGKPGSTWEIMGR